LLEDPTCWMHTVTAICSAMVTLCTQIPRINNSAPSAATRLADGHAGKTTGRAPRHCSAGPHAKRGGQTAAA
jgi:hypothetical protein